MLPTRLLVRSADYVADGNAALGPGPLNLIEVHPELLGLLLRGLRGIRLLTALLTTGGLLRRLLALLCCLTGGVLGLACYLARLIRGLTRHLLGLEARRAWAMDVDNASLSELRRDGAADAWRVARWNDTAHLLGRTDQHVDEADGQPLAL